MNEQTPTITRWQKIAFVVGCIALLTGVPVASAWPCVII
jgi:hypothetical protein